MNVLRVVISVGALAFLFWKIGLGETLAVLRRAQVVYLVFAFALLISSLVVRAFRWRLLLQGLGLYVPFARLVRLYFVGQFFSSFLPSQFGGDVVRAVELTQDTASSAAIGTVLLDRLTGLMVLFVMGLAVLPFQAAHMERWLLWTLVGVAGGGLLSGVLMLEGRTLRWMTARLPARLSLSGQGVLARVYAAVTGCGWRAVLKAAGVSVFFNLLNVLINWLCSRAVGMRLGLGYFFVVTPLIAVGGLIPSIGGWGVRETVATAVFSPAGESANVAAALGVAMGAVGLLVGLLGGLLYALEGVRGLRARRTL
jgi:uncharacterized membrane protein YbhN (UPF0104 family)